MRYLPHYSSQHHFGASFFILQPLLCRSVSIDRLEVVAKYRGNTIGIVELRESLTVPNRGMATFPVDLIPGFEDPAQSAQDYSSDCALPQAQQGAAGAAAGSAAGGGEEK